MTTHDDLISRFDALDADLGKILAHYRKVKRDRNALLEALKGVGTTSRVQCWCDASRDVDNHGHDGKCLAAKRAIAQTESEE